MSENIVMNVDQFLEKYRTQITQDSERLFVRDFLFPILGEEKMNLVVPQYPFIDSEGHHREIDFAIITEENHKIAFEIDGETYHAEGAITSDQFDDSLFRQNEILFHNWILRRYSYNQLKSPLWRTRVAEEIKLTLKRFAPELLKNATVSPNPIQKKALDSLSVKRDLLKWKKALVVMPTGTGKTYLAALDCKRFCDLNKNGRVLFVVHRNEILNQSRKAFVDVWGDDSLFGTLNGAVKDNVQKSRVLFASMQTLSKKETLETFDHTAFDYIIVDEVHHAAAKSYEKILAHFSPKFLLGVTATPDRQDRKDVLELFDYQLAAEFSIDDAISNGFLVGYEYHGLKDNIDYTKIRHNGVKYDLTDLERNLIIDKRNLEIYNQYVKFCKGDKTLGFCVSIKHAKAMADLFNQKGVKSVAIVSEEIGEKNSKQLIDEFRNNDYAVAFTVGIFNEGVDIPNIRCLLFLRPTESKTVFLQQLGRGLRLSSNKDRVIVLDFIGNYKRANFIRQYLSKKKPTETRSPKDGRYEKTSYSYNPKCSVEFEDDVQEILDMQDRENHVVNEDDLISAYYDLKVTLGRKPKREDIDEQGEYKSSYYISTFGSWCEFLKEIGEATESSFHYPQGFDFGHILYILECLKNSDFTGNLNAKYVKMNGGLNEGRLGIFQRQTKYKLQGMMEMSFLEDSRQQNKKDKQALALTTTGLELHKLLSPVISNLDLSFKEKDDVTWDMVTNSDVFVKEIRKYVCSDPSVHSKYVKMMLKMDAVVQMLQFLYFEVRENEIEKKTIYTSFGKSDVVKEYCEYNGIEVPTDTGWEHRCPFLFSVLETMGVLSTRRTTVVIEKILLDTTIFSGLFEGTSMNEVYQVLIGEKKNEDLLSKIYELMGKNKLLNEKSAILLFA